jgi:F-type H+-transporting ATPase subunit alpha
MEKAIRRGQLLRELLKQDRLAPLPVEFQLAWLIAFNEELFDVAGPEKAAAGMAALEQHLGESTLTLDSPREEWVAALSDWLAVTAGADR